MLDFVFPSPRESSRPSGRSSRNPERGTPQELYEGLSSVELKEEEGSPHALFQLMRTGKRVAQRMRTSLVHSGMSSPVGRPEIEEIEALIEGILKWSSAEAVQALDHWNRLLTLQSLGHRQSRVALWALPPRALPWEDEFFPIPQDIQEDKTLLLIPHPSDGQSNPNINQAMNRPAPSQGQWVAMSRWIWSIREADPKAKFAYLQDFASAETLLEQLVTPVPASKEDPLAADIMLDSGLSSVWIQLSLNDMVFPNLEEKLSVLFRCLRGHGLNPGLVVSLPDAPVGQGQRLGYLWQRLVTAAFYIQPEAVMLSSPCHAIYSEPPKEPLELHQDPREPEGPLARRMWSQNALKLLRFVLPHGQLGCIEPLEGETIPWPQNSNVMALGSPFH